MFKKFFKELIEAETRDEVEDIFYRSDGIDMMYQKEKLSWKDYELLEKLAQKLSGLM